jgi:hypothetical protein
LVLEMTVRIVIALLVFVADVWALLQLFGSPAHGGRKALWAAAIVFLPILGVLLWLRSGPKPSPRARRMV